jgi:hypothetical protein
MARAMTLAAMILLLAGSAAAGEAPPQPTCNPAYVAGVDAHGRPVAPADANAPVTVEVSPTIVTKVPGNGNPAVGESLAGVRLNGLAEAMNPACQPLPPFRGPITTPSPPRPLN